MPPLIAASDLLLAFARFFFQREIRLRKITMKLAAYEPIFDAAFAALRCHYDAGVDAAPRLTIYFLFPFYLRCSFRHGAYVAAGAAAMSLPVYLMR